MTREEAHTLLEVMAIELTGELADIECPVTERTKLLGKQLEAIDMAIEALTDSINCVKCKHYYETEDDTDVHGYCRMDTAHTDLIRMNKGAWLIPIISLVALTVAVVGLLAEIKFLFL